MLATLSAKSVLNMDESVLSKVVDARLKAIATDLADRGKDGLKRSVTIQLDFEPEVAEGEVYAVKTEWNVKSSMPAHRSVPYRMELQEKIGPRGETYGVLLFNDQNPEDPRQRTLDEVAGPADAKLNTEGDER